MRPVLTKCNLIDCAITGRLALPVARGGDGAEKTLGRAFVTFGGGAVDSHLRDCRPSAIVERIRG